MTYFATTTFILIFIYSKYWCQGLNIAEEGHPYFWSLTNQTPVDRIEFHADRGHGFESITHCHLGDWCGSMVDSVKEVVNCGPAHCSTNDSVYNESITCDRSTGLYTVQLEIKAVSRSVARWKNKGKNQDCAAFESDIYNITVYVKPESPYCSEPKFVNSNKVLIFTCSTDRVYPLVQSRLVDYSPIVKINTTEITCNYTTSAKSKIDYSVKCFIQLDIQNVQPITNDTSLIYAVAFSPVDSVEVLTNNATINLTLPMADVSTDCPDSIIANTNATCTCKITHFGSPPGKPYWFSKDVRFTTHDLGNGSVQLEIYFNSSVPNPEYSCSSKSVVGRQLKPAVYRPKFLYASGKVHLTTADTTDYKLCPEKNIPIFCNVSLQQLHTSTAGYLSINNVTVASIVSSDIMSNYFLYYCFQPPVAGHFKVNCFLLNQMGLGLIAEQQKVLNVSGSMYNNTDMIWKIFVAVIGTAGVICLIVIIKHKIFNRQGQLFQHINNSPDSTPQASIHEICDLYDASYGTFKKDLRRQPNISESSSGFWTQDSGVSSHSDIDDLSDSFCTTDSYISTRRLSSTVTNPSMT